MNPIRLFHLFLVLAVASLQAPRLVAQNDRGPALNNVPGLIAGLADTKPAKQQVHGTYTPESFILYSPIPHHVQGMARLSDGRYAFSHNTHNQVGRGLIAFSRPNQDAVFKTFGWGNYMQQHPSAMQACGDIVAVAHEDYPTEDRITSIHFFDCSDPDSPVELNHLLITNANEENFTHGIDAAGLVYNENLNCHYLMISRGSESGAPNGKIYFFKSNGLPLTDPNCHFIQSNFSSISGFTSASGTQLLYDASGDMYVAALHRGKGGSDDGKEKIALSKVDFNSWGAPSVVSLVSTVTLSGSGYYNNSSPGFRWGGGISVTGPNSIEVFASARLLNGGPTANYCVIKVWKGTGFLEDCRRYSDVSWLTSHNAFSAPSYGYPVINNQSLDLDGQLAGGARAFTLEAWEKANLNAPSGGAAYNNLKDAMVEGKVYLLNDPRRQPGVGGLVPGVNWPSALDDNLPKARFSSWLKNIGQYLLDNPTEIVTLILEGDASFEAYLSTLGELNGDILDLFMNQSDYDNLYFRTLGDMRSSSRRLAVLRNGETLDFNVKGRSFQFRRRFNVAVENTNAPLPEGLNTCTKRPGSADLNLIERLVVFNHWGQTYHSEIVRRWLDHCDYVNVPNFVVVNNVTDGIFGVQPKDAVIEFNRRINDRMVGSDVAYRIMKAGDSRNITQESSDDNAHAVISDNTAEWEFIRNSDNSYFIRLSGTNRYITAPANFLNPCLMRTDTDMDRARWYVEPFNNKAVRLFSKHSYAGTRKAMRLADNGQIKLSDNIDFVDINDQKFELLPATFLNATCKPATLVLDVNGEAILLPEVVKNQINYSGVCQAELFVNVDKEYFSCEDVGTQQVTLTVSNGADLYTSCTATVTVIDNTLPTVECPGAQIISANSICKGTVGSWSPVSVDDNCQSNLTITQSPTAITALNGHNDSKLVTLTAHDGHGNTSTCSFTVTMKDNTAPTVTCKNGTTNLDDSGIAVIGYGLIYDGGSDNCGNVTLESISKTLFNCTNLGTNTVVLTVNDGNGNTGTCNAIVTVVDNRAPTVVCKPYTAFLDDDGATSILPIYVRQSSSDNCSVVNLVSVVPNTFSCSHLGENIVTLTVNDGSGNTATCTSTVTVVDDIAPTVACKPITAYLNAAGTVHIEPNDVFQSGADNCGTVNRQAVTPGIFNCANLGDNTVILTVNDGNGNTATCTTTVTVVDNLAPSVVCKPYTTYLNDVGTANITTNDVFQSGADNCGTVNKQSVSPGTFNCSNLGDNTVTLTVNDGNGNTNTCTAVVKVVDAIAPTVVCKTFTAFLNAAGVTNIIPENVFQSGADNCGQVILDAVAPNNFNCAKLGSNPVTLVVHDGNGNSASCNTFVIVKDAIAPTMLCKNATLYLNSAGQATLNVAQVENGSFDNCSITFMDVNQKNFSCANVGANTVILGGVDQSQNRGQCTATVTVIDAILPITKCKNFTANLGANGTVTVANHSIDNGSYDNCTFTQSLTPNTFGCSNVGQNNVTLLTTDASGNTSSCSAVVTVRDVTAPTALCKNATIFVNDAGQATLSPSHLNNGSSDACGIATMTLSKTQFNCSDIPGSSQTVTLTLKDVNNNTSSCNAQVTTKDNIAPTAICENTTVQLGSDGKVTVYGADLAENSFDNCSVWSYSPVAKMYTTANIGANNLTITVKDWSGNASTCVSVVNVESNIGMSKGGDDRREPQSSTKSEDFAFNVYPNPGTGNVTANFQMPAENDFSIRVFDLTGRLVFRQESVGMAGENSLPINLKGIAPGVYLLDFQSDNRKVQKRLVVQE